MDKLGPYPSFHAFKKACLEVGVDVSCETFERLKAYVTLLGEKNKEFNLMGPNEIPKIWDRHVLDAIQLFPYIPKSASIADLGSGAGFPGVVIALLADRPVTLIESSKKKCDFLKNVSCGAEVINARIENIKNKRFGCLVSRALAPLEKMLSYAIPLSSEHTVCVFNKGKSYRDEISAACSKFKFNYTVHESATDSQGVVLVIEKIYQKT